MSASSSRRVAARAWCAPSNARSREVSPPHQHQAHGSKKIADLLIARLGVARASAGQRGWAPPEKCAAGQPRVMYRPFRCLPAPPVRLDTYRDPIDTTTPTTAPTTHPSTPPFPRSRHATPGIIAHRPRGYPGTFASYHSLCRLAANARLPNTAASIARFTRAPSIPATAHSPAYSKTSAA